jgi:hypothetical protein
MNSGPIVAMVWEGLDAVKTGRSELHPPGPVQSSVTTADHLIHSSPRCHQPSRLRPRHDSWYVSIQSRPLSACLPRVLEAAHLRILTILNTTESMRTNLNCKAIMRWPSEETSAMDLTVSRARRRRLPCGSRRASLSAGRVLRLRGSTSKPYMWSLRYVTTMQNMLEKQETRFELLECLVVSRRALYKG